MNIFTLTGASAAGKTTIFGHLLDRLPNFELIPSHTTRQFRNSDLRGEYIYYSKLEFERMKQRTRYLWQADFGGQSYLTTARSVLETKNHPELIYGMLLSPDVISLLKNFAESNGIKVLSGYVFSPSPLDLRERMAKRGDSPEEIERRIEICREWDMDAGSSGLFDYEIRNNGTIERAVQKAMAIIKENRPN